MTASALSTRHRNYRVPVAFSVARRKCFRVGTDFPAKLRIESGCLKKCRQSRQVTPVESFVPSGLLMVRPIAMCKISAQTASDQAIRTSRFEEISDAIHRVTPLAASGPVAIRIRCKDTGDSRNNCWRYSRIYFAHFTKPPILYAKYLLTASFRPRGWAFVVAALPI